MLKFKNFFQIISIFCYGVSVAKAYDVTCQPGGGFPPTCNQFTLTPITQPNELANFLNQPSNFIDNMTMSMNFDSQHAINYIPTDMFNHMISIQQFNSQNASISTIITNAFIHCENLQNIMMTYELFTNLPASFAGGCYNVMMLQIYRSNLQTIDENALRGLFSLQNLMLSYNQIDCLPPLLFQDTKGLQMIDLSNNKIKALHPILFKTLIEVTNVNLMANQITYIPDLELDISSSNQGSFNLMLSDNPIQAIHPLFLTHLFYNNNNNNFMGHQIQIMFASSTLQVPTCADINPNTANYNGIDLHNINGQTMWYQQNISYTYHTSCYSNFSPQMADNSLVTCGSIISTTTTTSSTTSSTLSPGSGAGAGNGTNSGSCSSDRICRYYLDYLNRYTCVLDSVDGIVSSISGTHYLTFTDANVERVYFANSQLSRIPNVLFTQFPNLNFLYVRNVGLGVINDHTFNQCGNLKYLDASYNDIIHIDETSLKNCTKLETIDLTGNPLDYISTQLYVFDPSLKTVHLQRNPDFTLN